MHTKQNGRLAANKSPAQNTVTKQMDSNVERYLSGNFDFFEKVLATIAKGAEHTPESAVATFAVKKVFSRPEFFGLGLGMPESQDRQHGGFRVFKPSPIRQSEQLVSGCQSQSGAFHMATAKSPTTPIITTGNTTHTQAELLLRASNHLNLALRELRQAPDNDGIQKATGRAVAAARALKQLCQDGATVNSRRGALTVTTHTDTRPGRVYRADQCGVAGDMDGETFLIVGNRCPDEKLARLVTVERVEVAA